MGAPFCVLHWPPRSCLCSLEETGEGRGGAQSSMGTRRRLVLLALAVATTGDAAVTSAYRRKLEATANMPFDADNFRVPPGYNAPQQVHITQGDQTGAAMMASWVTASEPGNRYVRSPDKMDMAAHAKHTRCEYFNYTSGFIHHCVLKHLQFSPYRARSSLSWPHPSWMRVVAFS